LDAVYGDIRLVLSAARPKSITTVFRRRILRNHTPGRRIAGGVNHSFIHCGQNEKADGISPSAYHLEVDVLTTLNLLALMVVIVIIKVKIIIKKR